MPISATSSDLRALLCHLLFLAPASTIFNFCFILVKLTSAHREGYLFHPIYTSLAEDSMFLCLIRLTGILFIQVSLTAVNSLTYCCLLGLCLSSHTPFFLHAQYITSSLKISKMPEWDIHFSLAHSPAPIDFHFFSLRLQHRRKHSIKCL